MDTNNPEIQHVISDLLKDVLRLMNLLGKELKEEERNMITSYIVSDIVKTASPSSANHINEEVRNDSDPVTHEQQPIQQEVSLVETRFAAVPENDDSSYYFLRTVVESSEYDSKFFAISVYSDGSCNYEMNPNIGNGSKLQELKDNQDGILISDVVMSEGAISDGCRITTIQKGKCVKENRRYRIVEPLKIKFES